MNDPTAVSGAPSSRIDRALRLMLHTRWSVEAWSVVREFRKAIALRTEIRCVGWFN